MFIYMYTHTHIYIKYIYILLYGTTRRTPPRVQNAGGAPVDRGAKVSVRVKLRFRLKPNAFTRPNTNRYPWEFFFVLLTGRRGVLAPAYKTLAARR